MILHKGRAHDGIWSLSGRLGVAAGNRHGTFTVDWRQHKDNYQIVLLGPMGIGVARITGSPDRVTLKIPRHAPMTARSPEALLVRSLGLNIPVTPLRYWVRGKPAPGPYQPTSDGFKQQGWTVKYLDYLQGLPTRIRLTRPRVKLIMVVTQWTT